MTYSVAKKQLVISLEYLGKHSIEIKKRLERVINEDKTFFSFKDKVPKNLKSQ